MVWWTEEVEIVAETVEKVADTVEDVAEDVEKLAEDVAENLPEGSKLKNVVSFVENAAKETAKDAQLAEDFLDKVFVNVIRLSEYVHTSITTKKKRIFNQVFFIINYY